MTPSCGGRRGKEKVGYREEGISGRIYQLYDYEYKAYNRFYVWHKLAVVFAT